MFRTAIRVAFLTTLLSCFANAALSDTPEQVHNVTVSNAPGVYRDWTLAEDALRAADPESAGLVFTGPEYGSFLDQIVRQYEVATQADMSGWTYSEQYPTYVGSYPSETMFVQEFVERMRTVQDCDPPVVSSVGGWKFQEMDTWGNTIVELNDYLVERHWAVYNHSTSEYECPGSHPDFEFKAKRVRVLDCPDESPFNNLPPTAEAMCVTGPKQKITERILGYCPEGNPCHVGSGSKSQTETDYSGPTLTFERHYHSKFQGGPHAGLGSRWTHNFAPRLFFSGSSPLGWQRPDGAFERMQKQSTTHYISERNGHQLRKVNGNWELYYKSGEIEHYTSRGRPLWRKDSKGSRLHITTTDTNSPPSPTPTNANCHSSMTLTTVSYPS